MKREIEIYDQHFMEKIRLKLLYYRYLALIEKELKTTDWLKTYYRYFKYYLKSYGLKINIKLLFEKSMIDILKETNYQIELDFEMIDRQFEFLSFCYEVDDDEWLSFYFCQLSFCTGALVSVHCIAL